MTGPPSVDKRFTAVFRRRDGKRHGFGGKTFTLETDKDGEPVVHRVNGKFKEVYYYESSSDSKIWEEVFEHFDDIQHVYFIAIDLSYESLNGGDVRRFRWIRFFSHGWAFGVIRGERSRLGTET